VNVDVALVSPGVLILVWIALPVSFAGVAWWSTGRVHASHLLLLWVAATFLVSALNAWLAQPRDPSVTESTWPGLGEAFLQSAVVFGAGLAAIALLARRQRARGASALTFSLVLRSVLAFAGVVLLLFVGTVALTTMRELSEVPEFRALAV